MLTVGSLFAGIGGLDLGLERAGMKVVWQVENDDYCKRVLAKHWPDVQRFDDVRHVGAHNLDRVDVVCGGFPCQDISNAGRRAGIDGERSGLWSAFHRIICELRPPIVLVENVAALLVRGMGRVLGDLAESGYDAEWDCIPAAAVGAPHIRERVYIVAYPGRFDGGWFEWWRKPLRHPRPCWGTDQPGLDRTRYGVPSRVDRLRGLGNAVVPQVAEYVGRLIVEHCGKRQ